MTDLASLPAMPAAKPAAAAPAVKTGGSAAAMYPAAAFQDVMAAIDSTPVAAPPAALALSATLALPSALAVPTVAPSPPFPPVVAAAAGPVLKSDRLPVIGRMLPARVPAAKAATLGQPHRIPSGDTAAEPPADALAPIAATLPPVVNLLPALPLVPAPPATVTEQTGRAPADIANPLLARLAPIAAAAPSVAEPPRDIADLLPVNLPPVTIAAPGVFGAIAMALAPAALHPPRLGAAQPRDDGLSAGRVEPPAAVPFAGAGLAILPGAAAAATLAAPPASSATTAPQDFATLVERLVEARAAAGSSDAPQIVTAALTHRQFGKVSLDFVQDTAGLVVNMTSADPGFARSAQTALAAVVPADAAGRPAATNSQAPTPAPSSASTSSSTYSQAQSQARPQPQPRAAVRGAARAAAAAGDLDRASGIFA